MTKETRETIEMVLVMGASFAAAPLLLFLIFSIPYVTDAPLIARVVAGFVVVVFWCWLVIPATYRSIRGLRPDNPEPPKIVGDGGREVR